MPAQNPCVLIATPTRGSPKMQYVQSVFGTIKDLARRGISSDFDPLYGTNLVAQRGMLATRFLARNEFTHIFFVDDDMTFPEDTCARLLSANKSVVCTIAPMRRIDLETIESAMAKGASFKQAFLAGHDWLIAPEDARKSGPLIKIEKVDILGFGAALIRRDALELMIANNAAPRCSTPLDRTNMEFYGFFNPRPDDLAALAPNFEDKSFYRRWQLDCGGEVWAAIDVTVLHIGDFSYGGPYIRATF
jgi:hypothetical protein